MVSKKQAVKYIKYLVHFNLIKQNTLHKSAVLTIQFRQEVIMYQFSKAKRVRQHTAISQSNSIPFKAHLKLIFNIKAIISNKL